ncbi:MAG TPA: hypothetical protein VK735_18030 [Pseudonocardia sp.]|nr:hypothetical protein [Pseudonocardia sp.]HTF49344.1 hypothetical protein [Pseudonocardia sp.]
MPVLGGKAVAQLIRALSRTFPSRGTMTFVPSRQFRAIARWSQ